MASRAFRASSGNWYIVLPSILIFVFRMSDYIVLAESLLLSTHHHGCASAS